MTKRLDSSAPRIFFFHLPKAGGTALKSAMQKGLPAAKFSPVFDNDVAGHRKLAGNYAGYRGCDVYFGHHGRDVFDAVADGHQCMTNFRHPVSRLVSLYNYFRHMVPRHDSQTGDVAFRAVDLARRASFAEFVSSTDPLVEVYVRDAHYRQLSNSMWSLDHVASVPENWRLIDRMPCFYVCEFPLLSAAWMRRTLGIGGIGVENVTRGDLLLSEESIDAAIVDGLCRRNARDLELYRYAVDHLLAVSASPGP